MGVVIRYLVKFTKYVSDFFHHQRKTSHSGCHSDDEIWLGQEERLFNEAEPKLCTPQGATINFTLKHECKLPCNGACPSGCPLRRRDRRRESPKSPNRRRESPITPNRRRGCCDQKVCGWGRPEVGVQHVALDRACDGLPASVKTRRIPMSQLEQSEGEVAK